MNLRPIPRFQDFVVTSQRKRAQEQGSIRVVCTSFYGLFEVYDTIAVLENEAVILAIIQALQCHPRLASCCSTHIHPTWRYG